VLHRRAPDPRTITEWLVPCRRIAATFHAGKDLDQFSVRERFGINIGGACGDVLRRLAVATVDHGDGGTYAAGDAFGFLWIDTSVRSASGPSSCASAWISLMIGDRPVVAIQPGGKEVEVGLIGLEGMTGLSVGFGNHARHTQPTCKPAGLDAASRPTSCAKRSAPAGPFTTLC
jgi:hypothetical protein